MAEIDRFTSLVGRWAGESALWIQPGTPAFESTTTAEISTVAGGHVLAADYTWTHEGQAQDGRLLLAPESEGVHIAWCDSFHTGAMIMELVGPTPETDVLAASGTYQVPGSEVWGWRIELEPQDPDHLQLRMYNILPVSMGGIEALAVQSDYTRA